MRCTMCNKNLAVQAWLSRYEYGVDLQRKGFLFLIWGERRTGYGLREMQNCLRTHYCGPRARGLLSRGLNEICIPFDGNKANKLFPIEHQVVGARSNMLAG